MCRVTIIVAVDHADLCGEDLAYALGATSMLQEVLRSRGIVAVVVAQESGWCTVASPTQEES